jgi:hypothetical protein
MSNNEDKFGRRVKSLLLANFPFTIIVHITRYWWVTMTDQTPSQDPTGRDQNLQYDGLQQLQNIQSNVQLGFNTVLSRLDEIASQLNIVPTRTAEEILSGQSRSIEGTGGARSRVWSVG